MKHKHVFVKGFRVKSFLKIKYFCSKIDLRKTENIIILCFEQYIKKINEAQLQKLLFTNRHKEKMILEKYKLYLPEVPDLSKHLEGPPFSSYVYPTEKDQTSATRSNFQVGWELHHRDF